MSRHHENKRDTESQESYRRMADVKSRLDRRPPRRPAPEVIDRIVDYAATRVGSSGSAAKETEHMRTEAFSRRNERPPARRRARRPFYSLAGAVAISLVVIGLGWWQIAEVAESPAETAVISDLTRIESAETEGPSGQRAATGRSQASSANTSGAGAGVSASSAEWNRADDVYEVYRRIQMIRARGQASYQPAAASGDESAAYVTSTN